MNRKNRGRPRRIATPEEFDRLADDYFDACAAQGEPVLLTGLILALGLSSKSAFYAYGQYEGFADSVQRARLRVEAEYEKALRTGPAAGPVFALRNFGWQDKAAGDETGPPGGPAPAAPPSPAEVMAELLRRREEEP